MAHFEKLCEALARYYKDMQSYTQISQINAKLWLGLANFLKYMSCPVMAKLYKVMIRYYQIMQRYTSYGQIWQVQSYIQIWAIYTKIFSEMAKIGQVIQSSGQFIQIYVQI